MKVLVLTFFFVFSGMLMLAQEECKDIIYPIDGESIIFNCCIKEVKHGNLVFFTREGVSDSLAAVAITKDGQYIDLKKYMSQLDNQVSPPEDPEVLYKGHNFSYYNEIYRKATVQRSAGIVLTVLGAFLGTTGVITLSNNSKNSAYNNTSGNMLGTTILVLGAISFDVGLPMWISGGIKRSNNRKAMEEIERNMNLSFGVSRDGVGLVLKF